MEKNIEEKTQENVSFATKSEMFIEKNKTAIIICVVAILVVVLAIFGIKKFVSEPRQEKASEMAFAAEQWFAQGEYETALNGNEQHAGLLSVIDKYGSTKTGKRAKLEAGICYLNMGNYKEALNYLKKYNGKDQMTPIFDEMCQGDAEIEQGNIDAAIKHYTKAAKMDNNYITAPAALFKAGMCHLQNNNSKDAIACFQQVKDNYPESNLASEMDRYIAYAENL